MYQLFKGILQMHKKGIFHRDIKPENILLTGDLVKLADLGSCRGTQGQHPYTEYISTRWYRAPECLMTDGYYDSKMDIWGAGCVMFEILTLVPLFPGKNELDMIHRIHNIIGTPPQQLLDKFKSHASHMEFNFPQKTGTGIDKLLPHVSLDCLDLLKQMLAYDPEKRITAEQVLQHDYFKDLVDAERQKEFHATLSSARASPGSGQFPMSLSSVADKSTTLYHEKSPYQQVITKKKPKKMKEAYSSTNKFPSLNVNLKLSSHFNDTSTEEEGDKGPMLPPLKQQPSAMQLETNFTVHMNNTLKKKEDMKKIYKPNINSQFLSKKSPKNSNLQASEYLLIGKKAM